MLRKDQLHGYQKKAISHIKANNKSMLWLDLGLGKLQPDDEPVLTPTGWVRMDQLTVGSHVIGRDGTPTEVLGVFPHGEMEIVKVTFTDGSWTRAGWDHLWYVQSPTQRARGMTGYVITTREIVDRGLTQVGHEGKRYPRWYIPMVEPVQYAPVDLPLDPYLVGVILGDAWISPTGEVKMTTDTEIASQFNGATSDHPSDGIITKSVVGIRPVVRELGLNGKRSWEKFIPEPYLLGSPDQRLALLQGLLDTDGSPIDKGGVEFSSTSEALTDGVIELVQSLGGVAKKKGPRVTRHQNGDGRPSWRVNVKLPGHLDPFRLTRKLDKWVRPTKYQPIRKIKSVEPDGVATARCIKVAAKDSLYVTRNFIVTHNTVSSLTAISDLMSTFQVYGALVLGPLRVTQTVWAKEARKWEHTRHLDFSLIHGSPEHRMWALRKPANVYLCNYEGVPWMVREMINQYLAKGKPLPFNMIIFDEVTKLKSTRVQQGGAWGRELQKILQYIPWRVGLTATPAPNGYQDLFGQYLVLDDGHRLGRVFENFRGAYFTSDYNGYKYEATEQGKQFIESRVADITIQMDADDYLDLPDNLENDIAIQLPPALRKTYDKLERDFLLEINGVKVLDVENAAVLSGKCRQFASGACYTNQEIRTHWDRIHDLKLDALVEIIEELQGDPLLLGYQFKHDAERIKARLETEGITYVHYDRKIKGAEASELEDKWNRGEIPVMIGHGQSIGHGLNLQYGCANVGWYGVPWSYEVYKQFNGRVVKRQGQQRKTRVHRLLVEGTVDYLVAFALAHKENTESSLRTAVDEYRKYRIEGAQNAAI